MPATASEHAGRIRDIRWTIRLRLTLIYGALFLASGAGLLAITYLLFAESRTVFIARNDGTTVSPSVRNAAWDEGRRWHAAALHLLLTRSAIALGIMAATSVALGWLMAGRALRPIRAMTEQARHISEHNLNQRLAVTGPNDELKDLADTFDGLLGRLDTAFTAQKHFVANASHELRTPLTLQRTLIEVTLADPDTSPHALRALCQRLLTLGGSQERLIDALLTLASSQRGLQRRECVDLRSVVTTVLNEPGRHQADQPTITADLDPARTSGSPRLLERLTANLIDNATEYNTPDGWVHVHTGTHDNHAVLRISNSGPVIPPNQMASLFQPFHRQQTRTTHANHHGLGLSIVAAIADAHHATITATPISHGGLHCTITFPAEPAQAAGSP